MSLTSDPHSRWFRWRRKFAETAAAPAVTRLTRAGRPGAVARVIAAQAVHVSGPVSPRDAARSALFLPKPGFTEDILESVCRDRRFRVLALDRGLIKAMARAFLPLAVDDNWYRNARDEHGEAMARYREFAHRVWPLLAGRLGLDMLLTGNFSYFAEQELIGGVEAHGQAFVAMHKECLKTPGLEPFFAETYRQRKLPFAGRAITVYNDIERRVQLAAEVAAPARIHITGMPRMDAIHRWRRGPGQQRRGDGAGRPGVLFMSFNAGTGAPKVQHKDDRGWERLAERYEGVAFDALARACHGAMLRLAAENPDLSVTIKTKNHATALATLRAAIGGEPRLPDNLNIAVGGDPFELITAADAICAFNSTSLFEALAADTAIVAPGFAEAAEPRLRPFVIDLEDAAEVAGDPDDLVARLAALARERHGLGPRADLPAESAAMLDHWTGNADGGAGSRAADLLHDLVDAGAATKAGRSS